MKCAGYEVCGYGHLSSNPIGGEQNFGPKEFTLGLGSRSENMKGC
jgi:hypothetical protein